MTPERMEELIALREIRDELEVLFKDARDKWTQACSDLNYAMLEELDYYHYIRGKTKEKPDWVDKVQGREPSKEVVTRRKADAMVEEMLKQAAGQPPAKEEEKNDSGWKSLWQR